MATDAPGTWLSLLRGCMSVCLCRPAQPLPVLDTVLQRPAAGTWQAADWRRLRETTAAAAAAGQIPPGPPRDACPVLLLPPTTAAMADRVRPPAVVSGLDWAALPAAPGAPAPRVYAWLSQAGSFRDFALAAGGASAWHHVVHGARTFFLVEPTESNVERFAAWWALPDRRDMFLADLVDACFALTVTAGQTVFVPGGWIVASHCAGETLSVGGEFLCLPLFPASQRSAFFFAWRGYFGGGAGADLTPAFGGSDGGDLTPALTSPWL